MRTKKELADMKLFENVMKGTSLIWSNKNATYLRKDYVERNYVSKDKLLTLLNEFRLDDSYLKMCLKALVEEEK